MGSKISYKMRGRGWKSSLRRKNSYSIDNSMISKITMKDKCEKKTKVS